MLKFSKLTLCKVRGVNDALRDSFLGQQFLPSRKFWDRETLRLVPRASSFTRATNKIDVVVLYVSLFTRLCLARIFRRLLWTYRRTLLASRFNSFFSRAIRRGGGKISSNNWFSVCLGWTDIFEQNDTLFRQLSQLNSNTVTIRPSHDGFVIFFENQITFNLNMTDLSANNDVIMRI